MVRRLQHRKQLVAQKPAEADLQERARRDVIAVEDREVFARRDLQRLVDVARLRVAVVRADRPVDADFLAERLELGTAAVVEHVNGELVSRIVERERGVDRRLHDRKRLVVGRNEDINGRPLAAVRGQRQRLALERPRGLEVAEQQHERCIDFRRDQQQAPRGVERAFPVRRLSQPPEHVAARRDDGQHDHHERRVLSLQTPEAERADEADARERKLLAERERHRDDEVQRERGEHREENDDDAAAPDAGIDKTFEARGRDADLRLGRRDLGRTHASFLDEAAIASMAASSQSPHARRSAAACESGS